MLCSFCVSNSIGVATELPQYWNSVGITHGSAMTTSVYGAPFPILAGLLILSITNC